MGIETIAIYSEGDADAPFVDEADRAVALGGRSAAESYLDGAKVLAAAQRVGADAIHPGYGFLSENADFARSVIDAGMAWVGPPPDAIAAMGDKLVAKRMMVEAGVPTLPSVEITDSTNAAAEAGQIGYPVLIKAAAGGGGKGMRVVAAEAELDGAIAGARREAANSFGDDTVFLEKYLPAPRHIEVQVLGDQHGNLLHCFERECSIQRRHQKVIEEAPSSALDAETRARIGAAGVKTVEAFGYYSAGTVEFLFDDTAGEFWFLEVNTRLQVEHPVTEEITGLDLVREMIRIAEGHPLSFSQDDLAIDGHAIEVRLYAEDPANNFLPAVGTVLAWQPPRDIDARFDSGIEQGSVVSVEFDPMLAKVIVHGPTRVEAAQRLALVLERLVVAGLTTNRDFLVSTLRSDEFLAGETRTNFIETVAPAATFEPSTSQLGDALAIAVLKLQADHHAGAKQLAFMSSGYRNSSMPPQEVSFSDGTTEHHVAYRPAPRSSRQHSGAAEFDVWINDGDPVRAALLHHSADELVAEIDGVRSSFAAVQSSGAAAAGPSWHIQGPAGAVEFTQLPRFPEVGSEGVVGGQTAPMPGAIRVVAVEVGQEVEEGQTLVVMEAMKMEHTIAAPGSATVTEVRCAVGDQVDNGQVLVVLEEAVLGEAAPS